MTSYTFKHYQGPWTATIGKPGTSEDLSYTYFSVPQHESFAKCVHAVDDDFDANAAATARLIQKSPEMLMLLVKCHRRLEAAGDDHLAAQINEVLRFVEGAKPRKTYKVYAKRVEHETFEVEAEDERAAMAYVAENEPVDDVYGVVEV